MVAIRDKECDLFRKIIIFIGNKRSNCNKVFRLPENINDEYDNLGNTSKQKWREG